MPIIVDLDVELAKKKMSVSELAAAIEITPVNVSVLKNGRAKAVRFSTLDAICRVLDCQPGDILRWVPETAPVRASSTPRLTPSAPNTGISLMSG